MGNITVSDIYLQKVDVLLFLAFELRKCIVLRNVQVFDGLLRVECVFVFFGTASPHDCNYNELFAVLCVIFRTTWNKQWLFNAFENVHLKELSMVNNRQVTVWSSQCQNANSGKNGISSIYWFVRSFVMWIVVVLAIGCVFLLKFLKQDNYGALYSRKTRLEPEKIETTSNCIFRILRSDHIECAHTLTYTHTFFLYYIAPVTSNTICEEFFA